MDSLKSSGKAHGVLESARGLGFALLVGCFLVPTPIASWAEEPPASDAAQERVDPIESVPIVTDPGSDEPEVTSPPEGPNDQLEPPAGYEVISIKGRAVSGIEADVPESVTQFDAESIAALGAGDISDLAKVTPNVEIRTAGATSATFFIRGVGLSDFSANAAGAVAIYIDDVVMNSPAIQLGQLFDVRTVELIRGPAAIGSHRNASAGAIKVYANKPTAEYAAKIMSSTGSFWSKDARNAFIRDTQGFVNLPLIEETLAMRVAFRVRKQDPFMTNGCGGAPPFADRLVRTGFPRLGQRQPAAVCDEGLIRFGSVSPVPPGLPTKVGDKGDWAARGALRLQPPGTDMDWLVSFHGSRLDQDSTLGQSIGVGSTADALGQQNSTAYWEPDNFDLFWNQFREGVPIDEIQAKLEKDLAERPLDINPYRGDYNRVGKTTLDIWGGHLRGEFSLGPIDVRTITAYEDYRRFRDADRDFSPDSIFEAISSDAAKQFVQELNFSGQLFDSAVRWNLGGAYFEEQLDADSIALGFVQGGSEPFGLRPNNFRFIYDQSISAFMAYGDFSWDFLEDFTLDLGARLNLEKKEFHICRQICFDLQERSDSDRWSEPTGKVGLTYHLNASVSVFTKFTHGYKAGHFNTNNLQFKVAKPEFIDAFEWGVNINAFERRLLAKAGFFYYKYKDYQVFVFSDEPGNFKVPKLVIINADRVQQYGAEVELELKPLQDWVPEPFDGLKIVGRFGWLASQFLDFTNVVFRNDQFGNQFELEIDYAGNQLINSPEFKVSGTVEWPFDLGEWGKLTPRYDFTWTDDIFFDPSEGRGVLGVNIKDSSTFFRLPEYTLGQKAFWIHNVRLSYQTPVGNVEIAAWVRNVMDERYKVFAFDVSLFAKSVINFVGDPRSVGGDVTITW